MKVRKVVYFTAPALLAVLALLTAISWVLEINVHSALTDALCPFLGRLFVLAFPFLVITTWLCGRKLETTLSQKLLVWIPIGIVAMPWGLLLIVFLGLMAWKGD